MATPTTISDYFRQSLQALGGRFQRRVYIKHDHIQHPAALLKSLDEKVLQPEDWQILEFVFQPIETVRSGNIYYTKNGFQRDYHLLLGKDLRQQQLLASSASGPVYRLFCLKSQQGEWLTYSWVAHERLLRQLPEPEFVEVGYVI